MPDEKMLRDKARAGRQGAETARPRVGHDSMKCLICEQPLLPGNIVSIAYR